MDKNGLEELTRIKESYHSEVQLFEEFLGDAATNNSCPVFAVKIFLNRIWL